jgi:bacterioferritin
VAVRFVGLDLAWAERNPSGCAVLDADGTLLDVRADLISDEAILDWLDTWLGTSGVIGIDMPTIIPNATGVRPAERALAADFRRAHAAPHPANRGRFPDGGRARRIIDRLAVSHGAVEALDVRADDPRLIALEVFPHPAHVRLFARDRIFAYKKKQRPWPEVLDAWAAYRAALGSLAGADPPLRLDERIPARVAARGYKVWDDTLDAITCAYVASYVRRWGMQECTCYGDLDGGYIVVPGAAVWRTKEAGTRRAMAATKNGTTDKPFLSDVKTLRERARKNLKDGAITDSYGGDVEQAIEILQSVLATEIVCVLRYTMHAIAATGIASDSVKEEFTQHAKEEQEHMLAVAERINQLGGTPNFNPEGLATRSASQYAEGEDLVDMIKENLIAERIAVEHYRELIRYFADKDPTTRVMIEGILAVEEEHANDMHDLLVAHEGKPMLPKN